MMRPATVAVGLALSLPVPAHALCDEGQGPAEPARIGAGPAGFGSLPEACPATELSLETDAALLDAASEDFYGSLVAGAALRGRYALDESVWVSAWLPGPQFLYVANATVEASAVELGPSALGLHVSLPVAERARLAPFARALVPTETVYRNATRYGFDHGFTLEYRLLRKLDVLGGGSFPLLLVDGSGTLHASFQPMLRAEGAYTPFRWFTVNVGFALRFRGGDDAALESIEPLLGLRFFPHRRVRIELAARLPLAGHDRTDLGAALGAGYRFDDPESP
jgi:hypothetical protein